MHLATGEIVTEGLAMQILHEARRMQDLQAEVAFVQKNQKTMQEARFELSRNKSVNRQADRKPRPAFVMLTTIQNERLCKIKNPIKRLRALRKMLLGKSCLNCLDNYLNHDNAQLEACLKALYIPIMTPDNISPEEGENV